MTRHELYAGLLWSFIIGTGMLGLAGLKVAGLMVVVAFISYAAGLAVGREE